MIQINHDLNIDLTRPEYPPLIQMHDGGNGMHQYVTAHLFSNGMPEAPSGCAFSLHWRKGDDTTGDISLDDAICDGHKVTFELPREILVGCPEVTLWLHIQEDNAVLHTFSFRLYVSQSIGPSGPVESI